MPLTRGKRALDNADASEFSEKNAVVMCLYREKEIGR